MSALQLALGSATVVLLRWRKSGVRVSEKVSSKVQSVAIIVIGSAYPLRALADAKSADNAAARRALIGCMV